MHETATKLLLVFDAEAKLSGGPLEGGCPTNRKSRNDLLPITGYVRGSPNGKICKSTNGTVGTIFTNGNQKTLNAFLLPMVPLVPTVPLVGHMVEFLLY